MPRCRTTFVAVLLTGALARSTLAAPCGGDLDPGFGSGGIARISNPYAIAGGVGQPDGKLLAIGFGDAGFRLFRVSAAGLADATFGQGGVVETSFTLPPPVYPVDSRFVQGKGLALQPDGLLVAVGSAGWGVPGLHSFGFDALEYALARYNADGSLDATFGDQGTIEIAFTDTIAYAAAVLVQPDGKIVVAGTLRARQSTGQLSPADFGVVRLDSDGSPDVSFGTAGRVTTDFGSDDQAFTMLLQPDGKIVVGGASGFDFALVRYGPDGTPDPTFGDGGRVVTQVGGGGEGAAAIATQPDGKLVVVGYARPPYPPGTGGPNFALVRYDADGHLDPGFGSAGIVTSDFVGKASAVVVQPDGRLVVGGQVAVPPFAADFTLVRYTPDGRLDASFGFGGLAVTGFFADHNDSNCAFRYFRDSCGGDLRSLGLQPDGRVVAIGWDFRLTAEGGQIAEIDFGRYETADCAPPRSAVRQVLGDLRGVIGAVGLSGFASAGAVVVPMSSGFRGRMRLRMIAAAIVIGRGHVRRLSAGPATLRVTLTRRGKRLLRRMHLASIVVEVTFRTGAGVTTDRMELKL